MKNTQSVLRTYETITLLARVFRHNSVTFDAKRRENVAEHSYSLAVLASAIADDINQHSKDKLDVGKIAQFAVVHDLTEAYMDEGDISVYASSTLLEAKKKSEELALKKLEKRTEHSWIVATIKDYETQKSPEARFVYSLDKLVVHMNVILSNKHHATPTFADYLHTEKRAREKIAQSYGGLLIYFDELCKLFRENPHFFKEAPVAK
jgi:putative hydrolases of HD superfamily